MSTHLHQLLDAFDPQLPLERARTIPSAWYHDQEVYDLEQANIFGSTWQVVGRLDQLRTPGAFVTTELAGEPILVVRDEQGVLRGFYNVCRHRAAQVLHEPCGTTQRLRCRYHGWTYDLKGHLRGTPEFGGVEEFCRADQGLTPIAVATWGPLVFVHQGREPEALDTYLAPLPERTTGIDLNAFHFVERREYEIACNWKVFVDNYQDGGYHVNTVHPGLAGALDYAHYRTENAGNTSVQISPLKPSGDATVQKVRTGTHAYYWWVFPNLMINLYENVMDTNVVLPLGPDRCRVLIDFYFMDVEGTGQHQFMADSIRVAHQIQLEDIAVCEEVQRGLKSRSYDTGRFSVKRESGGFHFHQLLAKTLRGEWSGPGL